MKSTITVEASKTKNYQKYTVSLQAEVEYNNTEELETQINMFQAICRKKTVEQIKLDGGKE